MEKRLTGVVLKTTDYKETDRLVTLLTKEEGKVTIKLRGVRTAKSKLRFASFPFFFGVYILTETKAGFVVTGVDPINRYDYLSLDLNYYYLATLIVEIADKLTLEGIVDDDLFDFVICQLNTLKGVDNPLLKAVKLVFNSLDIAGHGLNRDYPDNCNGFSYDDGGLVNLSKSVGFKIPDGMVRAVQNLVNGNEIEQKYLANLLTLLSSYFAAKTTKKLISIEQIIHMAELLD